MSELKKPAALQFRHNRGEGFVAGYEKEEMDKYLSEADKVIAELKEAQRWRKFSEEKPKKRQKVLFRAKYKTDNIRTWIGEFRNVDFDVFYASVPGWGCEFLPNEIFGWMPLPSAPKEEK